MKIFDISQEVFGCKIYPGDPSPNKTVVSDISKGDLCNLSSFSMCAHNGTHIDAPYHFYIDGKTVDEVDPEKYIGNALVVSHDGPVNEADAEKILQKANSAGADKRILFKGKAVVTADAAKVFAGAGVSLIGSESQTVGPEDAPMEVHLILLKNEVVLLEGIRLDSVPEGVYFLCAAPLNLAGADGSPCRAVLIDF